MTTLDCFSRTDPRRDAGGPGVCYAFLKGQCHRSNCKFAHDAGQPAPTTHAAICRDYQKGSCGRPYCKFKHSDEPVSPATSPVVVAVPTDSGPKSPLTPSRKPKGVDKRGSFGDFRSVETELSTESF